MVECPPAAENAACGLGLFHALRSAPRTETEQDREAVPECGEKAEQVITQRLIGHNKRRLLMRSPFCYNTGEEKRNGGIAYETYNENHAPFPDDCRTAV